MIKKYFRTLLATVSLIIVLTVNYFYNLNNRSLTILFAIYLALLWSYDIAKLKSDEKKRSSQ